MVIEDRYICFCNSTEYAYLWQTQHISTLKYQRSRKYSFQKLTQFYQENYVLGAPASNTDGFLWEMHVFLHLSWVGLFVQSEPFSTQKIMICKKYYLQKLTQFYQESNVLHAAVSNRDGFLWTDAVVSSTQLNRPIWVQESWYQPGLTEV
jgi:hypothetical protein